MPGGAAQNLQTSRPDFIFGSSVGMLTVRTSVEKALEDDRPVLITGESGTGKEAIARYLHLSSSRATGPFVRLNCGSIHLAMPGGEFHGSFVESCDLRMAAGGTLFLDEIGDMDPQQLLQVLDASQSGNLENAWSILPRIVCSSIRDVRAMSDLDVMFKEVLGRFAHQWKLLPLRDRKQDIPKLCDCIVTKLSRSFARPRPKLSSDVLEWFQQQQWPGNIRELENWIARIVIFGTEEAIFREFRQQMGFGERRHRGVYLNFHRIRRMRRQT